MEESQLSAPAPAQVPIAAPAPCWSNIVKTQAPPKPVKDLNAANRMFVESCKSSKGIAVAVVDANAIIEGGERLSHSADKFVSVPEVRDEIRDPMSRHRLAFIPFTVEPMEPSPESLNKVVKFAKATGDLQTLSDVDLKLIALTYTLESQIHGTSHLRDNPPPIHSVNVRRLPEKELPGWGSNVPNLEEWEALEQEDGEGSIPNSRILPLKDLNLNVIPSDGHSEDVSVENKSDSHSENKDDVQGSFQNYKRHFPKKKEINIEGKMVADGIDASQGQVDDNAGDWMPAVSRSTHRRFLRRKARREYYEASSEKDDQQVVEENKDTDILEAKDSEQFVHQTVEKHAGNGLSQESEISLGKDSNENLSILKQVRQEEAISGEHKSDNSSMVEATSKNNASIAFEENGVDIVNEGLDQLEISSQTNESINDGSYADDDSSEQSWMLRSMSESSVACVTTDFAMQNVLLQMGLRLLAPGGMQIRELHRWILKCHACYTVTAEIGRIFCPKCGNGGTLRKVAVTVGENGVVLAARRPRITLRGTKFSLPLPQGGRDAVTKNLVLREDQLPQKFLRPRTKKATKEGDDLFTPDSVFTHHTDKRAPLQPPVRQALAVFSGKRNPNDNHYSRSKHK